MGLTDLLFPRRCLGCGRPGAYFCSDCSRQFVPLSESICPMCSRPAISGTTHAACLSPLALDGLTAFFPYRGLVRKALTTLKYNFISDLAEEMTATMIRIINTISGNPAWLPTTGNWCLVPIPLHGRRQRWRGFNQSALLGQILARQLGLSFMEILERRRATRPQTKLGRKERKENIRWAFVLANRPLIAGSQIFLFDDVWTTGATLREAGKVLKRAKAAKVWGLVIAR